MTSPVIGPMMGATMGPPATLATPPPPEGSDSLRIATRRQLAVDRERLRVIWGQTPAAVLASIVVGSGTSAVILALTSDRRAWSWLAAVVLITLCRLAAYLRLRDRIATVETPVSEIAGFGALAWATAACWGLLTPLFLRPAEPLLFSIIVIAQFGIISGALGSLGSSLPIYYGFVLLTVVPMIVVQAKSGGVFGWSVTLMAAAYLVGSLSFARVAYRTLVEAIVLRFANEDLVSQLTEEKDGAVSARRDAERATAARTRFLAAASHDLRQPLHAQALFLETLSARADGDPDTRHLVQRISATSKSLRELLDSLLDVSKLDAGAVSPQLRPFPIQSLFDRIATDFEHEAERKGLRLRVMSTRLWARSDPDLVLRILRNLVSNAVRHTDRGGIVVGCRRGDPLRLQVIDSGRGIPASALELVFEEFSQLDNPERDRTKGIGLGLAIVRRLSRLLDAELTVSSRTGSGSAFSLSLSLAPTERSVEAPLHRTTDPGAPHRFDGEHVLVVDDEAEVRNALVALLSTWGLEPRPAGSVAEAASIADHWRVDAIIADYRLRGAETGRDVVTTVRASCGRNTPALLVTGDTAPERIREAQEADIPLLHKPLAPDVLRDHLAVVLSARGVPPIGAVPLARPIR